VGWVGSDLDGLIFLCWVWVGKNGPMSKSAIRSIQLVDPTEFWEGVGDVYGDACVLDANALDANAIFHATVLLVNIYLTENRHHLPKIHANALAATGDLTALPKPP